MTPKEKAGELFYKFWEIQEPKHSISKKYVLIAVDEILKELIEFDNIDGYAKSRIDYFNELKQEIEKL